MRHTTKIARSIFTLMICTLTLFSIDTAFGQGRLRDGGDNKPGLLQRRRNDEAADVQAVPAQTAVPAVQAGQAVQGQAVQTQPVQGQAVQGQAVQGQTAQAAPVSDGTEFNIPANATPEELLAYADKLMNTERQFNTQEESRAWFGKMVQTVFKVSNQILSAADISDETYTKALDLKGDMIYSYGMVEPKAFDVYEKFVRSLPEDKRLMGIEGGQKIADRHLASFLHWGCTRTVQQNGTPEEMKKYIDEFLELLLRDSEFAQMIPDLVYPISEFANSKKDPAILQTVLGDFVAGLKNSDKPELNGATGELEGMVRFTDLKGKPFELVGTLADGTEFDASEYKGKIVLVNFWATWVPTCLALYPDLLALYVQYKDQGFEIVGYSVDDEVDKLNDYLKSKKVLWPNLSESLSREKKQPLLTEFYGISGLPTMLLIGKDGRVLENDLNIDQLKAKLEELFK